MSSGVCPHAGLQVASAMLSFLSFDVIYSPIFLQHCSASLLFSGMTKEFSANASSHVTDKSAVNVKKFLN